MDTTIHRVFFEPWSLGDVFVAASSLREMPESAALACHTKWHPILKVALPELRDTQFLAVDLPYTTRARNGRFDFTAAASDAARAIGRQVAEVVSIRTDPRDYLAARRLFPNARIRMTGWIPYVAHFNWLVDVPFAFGPFRVRNRYAAWAKVAGLPFRELAAAYRTRQQHAPRNGHIVIHVGAQWRSRQYPFVAEVRALLEREGHRVSMLAGPSDVLPRGVAEESVRRTVDAGLIHALKEAELVLTNDSGPMHLAALLGCRTLSVARISNIREWLPPETRTLTAPAMPNGYRPDRLYTSDTQADGWPPYDAVVRELLKPW